MGPGKYRVGVWVLFFQEDVRLKGGGGVFGRDSTADISTCPDQPSWSFSLHGECLDNEHVIIHIT